MQLLVFVISVVCSILMTLIGHDELRNAERPIGTLRQTLMAKSKEKKVAWCVRTRSTTADSRNVDGERCAMSSGGVVSRLSPSISHLWMEMDLLKEERA